MKQAASGCRVRLSGKFLANLAEYIRQYFAAISFWLNTIEQVRSDEIRWDQASFSFGFILFTLRTPSSADQETLVMNQERAQT